MKKVVCLMLMACFVGFVQAAYVWDEDGTMVYDGAGVDSGIDPFTQDTGDDDVGIGANAPSVGSLIVLSGTLILKENTSWGDKVGHMTGGGANPTSDFLGAVTVENGATLEWYVNNDNEDRLMFGNNNRVGFKGIADITLNGGTFNITGDASFDHAERQVRFGSDGGIGNLILNAGTMTISIDLPFAFGDKWLVNGTSWTTAVNPSVSTMTIDDGSLVCSGSSIFGVGTNDKINFISGGTGKLSIKDWTSTKFAGLIGNLQIDGVDVTDLSGFSVGTEGAQGTLSVNAKTQLVAPASGAINVDVDQDLFWNVIDPNVTHVDLYFYTESDPNLHLPANKKLSHVAVTASMTYEPGTLANETTYYWSVDTYEPNGIYETLTPGGVWSFTTVGIAPEVSAVSPAITAKDAALNEDAVLWVTGTNVDTYQWYKEGVGALSNGADYDGVTTNTLTIYDVQLADEGYYYCQVDNDNPGTDPVDSASGLVMTKRLIIHYPLDTTSIVDGNEVTPDVVGGFDMTLMSGAVQGAGDGMDYPALTPGVTELGGSGLFFNNSNSADPNSAWGQYATAGDVDMEAMGDGLTISFWVQWIGDNTNWQGILNRRGSWNASDMMWRIDKNPTTGDISFGRRDNGNEGRTVIDQGQWNFITFTVSNTGVIKSYNNGELVSTVTGFSYGTGVNSGFKMGCNNDDGSDFFYGILDDVKVYNYARTTEQVAQDYLAVKGGWVCDNEGTMDLTYDFDGNCQVDLGDFAKLAVDWLNSNRIYPN